MRAISITLHVIINKSKDTHHKYQKLYTTLQSFSLHLIRCLYALITQWIEVKRTFMVSWFNLPSYLSNSSRIFKIEAMEAVYIFLLTWYMWIWRQNYVLYYLYKSELSLTFYWDWIAWLRYKITQLSHIHQDLSAKDFLLVISKFYYFISVRILNKSKECNFSLDSGDAEPINDVQDTRYLKQFSTLFVLWRLEKNVCCPW